MGEAVALIVAAVLACLMVAAICAVVVARRREVRRDPKDRAVDGQPPSPVQMELGGLAGQIAQALVAHYDPDLITYLRSTERFRTPDQDVLLLTERLATFATGSQERLVTAVARLEADVANLAGRYDKLEVAVSAQRDKIPSDGKIWSISVTAMLGVCALIGVVVAVLKFYQ